MWSTKFILEERKYCCVTGSPHGFPKAQICWNSWAGASEPDEWLELITNKWHWSSLLLSNPPRCHNFFWCICPVKSRFCFVKYLFLLAQIPPYSNISLFTITIDASVRNPGSNMGIKIRAGILLVSHILVVMFSVFYNKFPLSFVC